MSDDPYIDEHGHRRTVLYCGCPNCVIARRGGRSMREVLGGRQWTLPMIAGHTVWCSCPPCMERAGIKVAYDKARAPLAGRKMVLGNE